MKVRYAGPTGAVNRDVGRATGQGDRLVAGREYDVPEKLAEKLVKHVHWSRSAVRPAPTRPPEVKRETRPPTPRSTTSRPTTPTPPRTVPTMSATPQAAPTATTPKEEVKDVS